MWRDAGTWIALGVSVVFIVAGVVMHRIFVKILKNGSIEPFTPLAGLAKLAARANPTGTP
ncbi:hypothetical protein RCH06_001442 [Polaromonas sp. CG_9.5]|uniref:hypothetical protein n=1 Tax=Polaromonas sp. CG_9.5 TaxID=3071705 RepID=UPI002DFE3560|nr:hypothetical protein [Polaromonas sp. CG_9.5]